MIQLTISEHRYTSVKLVKWGTLGYMGYTFYQNGVHFPLKWGTIGYISIKMGYIGVKWGTLFIKMGYTFQKNGVQ